MKKTILFAMAIAIVALSLLVYGCGPSTQTPEKKTPSTAPAPTAPAPSTPAPAASAPAPAPATATPAPATPEAATSPDSDLNVNQEPTESNPTDLPEPSPPQ